MDFYRQCPQIEFHEEIGTTVNIHKVYDHYAIVVVNKATLLLPVILRRNCVGNVVTKATS